MEELITGDIQILQEVALNERLVTHPKLGLVRLRMPTLDLQKKIESVARAKRKMLKEAKDSVIDEHGNQKFVQSYKSKEQLEKEYADLGWWTDLEKTRLAELSEQHIQLLAELEFLGFDSDAAIYIGYSTIRNKLGDLCKNDLGIVPQEVNDALDILTMPGGTALPSVTDIIKENSNSTEVDDLLEKLSIFQKQYNVYIQLAKTYGDLISLQSQQANLFSDSWQEQLQYYVRLAQVFYCTEKADTQKPIWSNLEAIESEQDVTLIRWIFGELNAFWQGISDDTREKMDKYSFTAPRGTEQSSTDGSPAPQESLAGGEQLVKEQTPSTPAMATKAP